MHLDQEVSQVKISHYISLTRITNALVIGVPVVAVLILMVMQFGGGTDIKPILGSWNAAGNDLRMTFHPDKTVDLGPIDPVNAAAAPAGAVVQGSFFPNIDGMVTVKLKDGRVYTAFFRELTPDQFDLQDKHDGSVVIFKRAP